jgi:hypothetical protein
LVFVTRIAFIEHLHAVNAGRFWLIVAAVVTLDAPLLRWPAVNTAAIWAWCAAIHVAFGLSHDALVPTFTFAFWADNLTIAVHALASTPAHVVNADHDEPITHADIATVCVFGLKVLVFVFVTITAHWLLRSRGSLSRRPCTGMDEADSCHDRYGTILPNDRIATTRTHDFRHDQILWHSRASPQIRARPVAIPEPNKTCHLSFPGS